MELMLSSKDFVLLKQVLERYVSNLRMEIADTDNADWRKEMHEDEDRAKQILARLAVAEPHDEPQSAGWEPLAIVFEGYFVKA